MMLDDAMIFSESEICAVNSIMQFMQFAIMPLKSYLLLGNSEIILIPVSELGGS